LQALGFELVELLELLGLLELSEEALPTAETFSETLILFVVGSIKFPFS